MSTNHIISIALSSLFILALWQALWCALITASACLIIYYKLRINSLKDQRGELQRTVDERNVLLSFSTENEKKYKRDLESAARSKTQLLTKLSHEIRTPMNGVIGMASLLKETQLSGEQQDYSETIRSSAEKLLIVINDILLEDALSKAKSGKESADKKDFDLVNCIEEVLEVFGSKMAGTDVELAYQVDPSIPEQIMGDSLRFRQVLMNLVENAVKFTQQGEVIVRVTRVIAAKGDSIDLEIEVVDSGVGIPEDKVKILSRDFASKGPSIESQKSEGLGLVICKRVVGLMGGRIEVTSKVGKGTTMKFTMSAKASAQKSRLSVSKDMTAMKDKKALVVYDNAIAGEALKSKLEQWNFIPTLVGSGKQALDVLSTSPGFELMFTDMKMPEMNGIELAQSVREQYPQLPIVLLTWEGDKSHAEHPALFSAVVTKPVRQHSLSKNILKALGHSGKEDDQHKGILSADFSEQNPLRILIAEDNRVSQKLVMRALFKLGYNPDIAQNGKEVLEEVSHINYDLILMDVEMPEMDGLEATRMIRLCLSVQPIIVAMTANSMQGDKETCLKSGMNDYISKPIHLEELVTILEKCALQVKNKR